MKPVPADLRGNKNKKYQESFRGLFLLGEHRGWVCGSRHCSVAGNPVSLLGWAGRCRKSDIGLGVMLYNYVGWGKFQK